MITQERWYGGARRVLMSVDVNLGPGVRVFRLEATTTGLTANLPELSTIRQGGEKTIRGGPVFLVTVEGSNAISLAYPGVAGSISVSPGATALFSFVESSTGVAVPTFAVPGAAANTYPVLGAIIAGGGQPPSGESALVDEFTFATTTWAAGPTMNQARAEGCGAYAGNRFYIAQNRSGVATWEALEDTSSSWATLSTDSAISDSVSGQMACDRVRVILFHGGDTTDPLTTWKPDVEGYTIITQVRSVMNQMPSGRSYGGIVNFPGRGRFVILAGLPTLSPPYMFQHSSDTFETIDIQGGTTRRSFGSFLAEGEAHMVGGVKTDVEELADEHDSYNPTNRTWTAKTPPGGTTTWEPAGYHQGEWGYLTGGIETDLPSAGTPFTEVNQTRVYQGTAWAAGTARQTSFSCNQATGVISQ